MPRRLDHGMMIREELAREGADSGADSEPSEAPPLEPLAGREVNGTGTDLP